MKTINPATGETIKEYELMDDEEIYSIIKNADVAQQQWAKKSFRERAKILNRIAAALEDQKEEVAELMAREMGKPLPQGQSEAEKCAWVCEYYAEHAADFL